MGSSTAALYALDAETGRRRWSYDTTPRDPVLRDRNDLNGSPALGRRGVYIGGEHGLIVHVPYDWCLRRRDRALRPRPGRGVRRRPDADGLRQPRRLDPARRTARARWPPPPRSARACWSGARGRPLDGALAAPTVDHRARPSRSRSQLAGDGHFIHVVPEGFLRPGTRYSVRVAGGWEGDGAQGPVDGTIRFRTAPVRRRGAAAGHRRAPGVRVPSSARLAVPLPPIVPSLNQIGFDSYDMVVGALDVSKPDAQRRGLAAALGGVDQARPRGRARGRPARRVLVPARGSLPRRLGDRLPARAEPHIQLRRRAAAAVRAADAARRPAPLPRRRGPLRGGVLSRRARLRAGLHRHRTVQQGPHAAGQRHVRDRPLSRCRPGEQASGRRERDERRATAADRHSRG